MIQQIVSRRDLRKHMPHVLALASPPEAAVTPPEASKSFTVIEKGCPTAQQEAMACSVDASVSRERTLIIGFLAPVLTHLELTNLPDAGRRRPRPTGA